ncbi:hypothetical protein ETD86_40875 [Nonomuraea turkmeniaca]|uniref:Uncharacterized protein n=1 Tax=Nonomuraea turkmeniaca TaxID=103838 RepID=A0A5S4F1W6_9ACTN|nr:hypothetical protein [Nonomuraea turkmeniaca]TMR10081.1 hypothetical protein ETD86_40875 [Nonomuraea turkmeniaca]
MPALPADATLLYHRGPSHGEPSETEALLIRAHHPTDGTLWNVRCATIAGMAGPYLKIEMANSHFVAWAQLPELFSALAGIESATLDDVARILDELGATDETVKHDRWREEFYRTVDQEREAFDFSFDD